MLFTGRGTTWLESFSIILRFMFIFFPFSLSLLFSIAILRFPCKHETKVNENQGCMGPSRGEEDQTLFDCHMWGWLNEGHTNMNECIVTLLRGPLMVVLFCDLMSAPLDS